jgi:signal transduction histidine kinase
LVTENVELLIGDIEAGLLETLGEAPDRELDPFLTGWERNNPLVRAAFRCSSDGQILRPALTEISDEARGFRRRFSARLAENPPWQSREEKREDKQVKSSSSSGVATAKDAPEMEARRQVASNVLNVQNARKETQALAKKAPEWSGAPSSLSRDYASTEVDQRAKAQSSESKAQARAADRRGWVPLKMDGRLHLLGWLQPGGAGDVRGVEVNLSSLVSRLAGAMPAELAADEGYVLRDDKGRVVHQAGTVPRDLSAPSTRVPLAAESLPGWEVAGFLSYAPMESGSAGFFLIGSLLTAILMIAILAAGSLLLWQARRSEAEAVQKTSFVANVSHEFKTPLTTIRLYAELLEQGRVAEEGKREDYLKTIGRETQRLARLVNNVLDFSRLEQGQKKFKREELDLAAELSRLFATHAPRLAEAGLKLNYDRPARPVVVQMDRDAAEQILLNLLDNACKYASDGGEITVSLSEQRPNGDLELRVLDRGPGVPRDQRELIFEKFHRIDDTLTADKAGTGLGLSIARQLARGLGGQLYYEDRPGGGAVFIWNILL